MANSTGIRNIKAADPGVAFDLDLPESQNLAYVTQITVELHVRPTGNTTMDHVSSLTFYGPITEISHCIVLPYGCNQYPEAGGQVEVRIKVLYHLGQLPPIVSWWPSSDGFNSIPAASGKFSAGQLVAH